MSFLHRSNRFRLAMDLTTCGALVLATLVRWDWYSHRAPSSRASARSESHPRRSDPPKPQLIAATFVMGSIGSAPLSAQGWKDLPPGSYTLEMRDPRAENPYQGIVFRFVRGGDLIWEREDLAIQMMEWSLKGDTLTLRQSDGCVLNPVGVYQVQSRPEGGFSLLVLDDGCDPRAAAVSSTYLRPVSQ